MRTLALTTLLATLAAAVPAHAEQDDDLFARKPYVWREDERDKRLMNTKLMKAMETGFSNPACARIAGSLLAAFAEAAPYFQKRDDRFALFKVFTDPITTDKFPADDFLVHMLHRAMLDGKAPDAWLSAAKALKSKHKAPIDIARLAYAVDGPTLIDSIDFGIATFIERYRAEVLLAPTIAQASALERFQDRYLDRDFAWGGLALVDIHKVEPPKPKKGKKARKTSDDEEEAKGKIVATLIVPLPPPPPENPLLPQKRPEPIRVSVQLEEEQYLDLKKVVVSNHYLVHGRFNGFKPAARPDEPPMILDIREGLLFEEHDWSRYGGFADASDVEACELAVNDLSPLGLKDRQGVGQRDGFAH